MNFVNGRDQVALAPLEKINFGRPKQTDTCPKNIDDDDSTEDNLRKNFTSKRLTQSKRLTHCSNKIQEQKFKDLKLLVPEIEFHIH